MKVTLNWLKQYVEFDWSPEALSERLTMIGIEVEGVQKLGGEFEGVVIAQVGSVSVALFFTGQKHAGENLRPQ